MIPGKIWPLLSFKAFVHDGSDHFAAGPFVCVRETPCVTWLWERLEVPGVDVADFVDAADEKLWFSGFGRLTDWEDGGAGCLTSFVSVRSGEYDF